MPEARNEGGPLDGKPSRFKLDFTLGNVLTMVVILAGIVASHISLSKDVEHNSRRISALSGADTRRAKQISETVITAIEALKREVAVLNTNFERSEKTMNADLQRLRDEIGRVRWKGRVTKP